MNAHTYRYRLPHMGLTTINGVDVTPEELATAAAAFSGLNKLLSASAALEAALGELTTNVNHSRLCL